MYEIYILYKIEKDISTLKIFIC